MAAERDWNSERWLGQSGRGLRARRDASRGRRITNIGSPAKLRMAAGCQPAIQPINNRRYLARRVVAGDWFCSLVGKGNASAVPGGTGWPPVARPTHEWVGFFLSPSGLRGGQSGQRPSGRVAQVWNPENKPVGEGYNPAFTGIFTWLRPRTGALRWRGSGQYAVRRRRSCVGLRPRRPHSADMGNTPLPQDLGMRLGLDYQ